MSREIQVHDNADSNRFEARIDGHLAGFLEYRVIEEDGSPIYDMFHTRTLDAYGGQGVASALTEFALEYVVREGGSVIPSCWFVSEFIDKHPVYSDLLPN